MRRSVDASLNVRIMNNMNVSHNEASSAAETDVSIADDDSADGYRSVDIQAVGRTAQILSLLGLHREHVTAQTTAELTKLNRTTAHRYLSSMEQAGLLERLGPKYTAGPLLAQLSAFHQGRKQLMSVAPPRMAELVRSTGLTSALSIYGSNGPVVIHTEENHTDEILLTVPLGTQLDMFSAHAQVWLAHGAHQAAEARTMSMLPAEHRRELDSLVEETRTTGVGLRSSDSGYVAIAAPIWSGTNIRATLALLGTPIVLPAKRDTAIAEELRTCAQAISIELGAID